LSQLTSSIAIETAVASATAANRDSRTDSTFLICFIQILLFLKIVFHANFKDWSFANGKTPPKAWKQRHPWRIKKAGIPAYTETRHFSKNERKKGKKITDKERRPAGNDAD
jgi:hypothetical protein